MRRTTRRAGLMLFALTLAALFAVVHAPAASARPWLGVYTQEITGELRDGMDLTSAAGVLVNRVVTDGPADRAGLQQGDVIVRFNSRAVESPAALALMVGEARDRQEVAIQILRAGEQRPEPAGQRTHPRIRGRSMAIRKYSNRYLRSGTWLCN